MFSVYTKTQTEISTQIMMHIWWRNQIYLISEGIPEYKMDIKETEPVKMHLIFIVNSEGKRKHIWVSKKVL